MQHEKPLWYRIYFWPEYTAVVRLIGYAGLTYRELTQQLEPLYAEFGKAKVESAVYHLTMFEGQMTVNPKPLAHVQLRGEARKIAFGLLGPPPEHPWFHLWKKPERLPLPWDPKPEEPKPGVPAEPEAKPKKTRARRKKGV